MKTFQESDLKIIAELSSPSMSIPLALFLTSLLSGTASTTDSSGVVKEIRIEGNRVTKEYVIRREIKHSVGAPFDSLTAVEDRNRIDNLEIFSEVTFTLVPNGDGSQTLVYQVAEAWRVFPIPLVIYEEETGWSLGAAVMIKNFRGRDETVEAAVGGGGTRFGAFRFSNPWIAGDHISVQAHLYLDSYDHPFLQFVYRERDGEVTFGRYFGYKWKLWITGSLEERRVDHYSSGKTPLRHRYFQSKIQLIYDTRDLYIDPSSGVMIYNELRPEIGLDSVSPHHTYWDSQMSVYGTVVPGRWRWVAGASLFFHKYFGRYIPYRTMMVGGAKSVRGWAVLDSAMYEEEPYRAGLNEYHASFELRQTLIPKHLIGPRMEFGLILAEFVDVGAAHDRFWKMLTRKPIAGVGIGVRTFIPGALLFRVDFGVGFYDGHWQAGQWHIDMGHKF